MSEEDSPMPEDISLLSQLREGSRTAFNSLYEKYWDRVYVQAYRHLGDPESAEDITQDIFLQLWLRRSELVIRNLPGYLSRATRNNVFKRMEKEQRYTPIPELLARARPDSDGADTRLLLEEFQAAYEAVVATFPSGQQTIFKMRYHHGLSTGDIALRLRISRKTVQNQLGRCLNRLRGALPLILAFVSS